MAHPWLVEPDDNTNNFLYLKIKGYELPPTKWQQNSFKCATNNRIIVYSGIETREPKVVCPHEGRPTNAHRIVEVFFGRLESQYVVVNSEPQHQIIRGGISGSGARELLGILAGSIEEASPNCHVIFRDVFLNYRLSVQVSRTKCLHQLPALVRRDVALSFRIRR
ncbi:hypothetical protein GE061_017916, partial [Apolygus lucorum]